MLHPRTCSAAWPAPHAYEGGVAQGLRNDGQVLANPKEISMNPIGPISPVVPVRAVGGANPVNPVEPVRPVEPIRPVDPGLPESTEPLP